MEIKPKCSKAHTYKFTSSGQGESSWICEVCSDVIIEYEDSQP